jgi:hypothetical protein
MKKHFGLLNAFAPGQINRTSIVTGSILKNLPHHVPAHIAGPIPEAAPRGAAESADSTIGVGDDGGDFDGLTVHTLTMRHARPHKG